MRKFFVSAILIPFLVLGPTSPAGAGALPGGYRVVSSEELAPGVVHLRLERERPAQLVHVARVSPSAPVSFRAVLSNEAVAGPGARLERTSAMCIRVKCLVAVNADFYSLETGEPLGAVVSFGEMRRSPNDFHHQLIVGPDRQLSSGRLEWTGTVMPTDLEPVTLQGVNRDRQAGEIVLYTPSYGPSTGTNTYGEELLLEVLRPPPPLLIGQTSLVRILGRGSAEGDSPIPAGGAVLSGHGRGAQVLADLWRRVEEGSSGAEALLRLEADPGVMESVGGSPILVREGRRWFSDEAKAFVRGRHPRTIVGWNSAREVLLVTVDGRQPGRAEGMSLGEAADLMIALGAIEAINLDGGGSTTFVVRGTVVNGPSDALVRRRGREQIVHAPRRVDALLGNVERPVAVALALVAASDQGKSTPIALGDAEIKFPRVLAIGLPPSADAASDPRAALPALVGERPVADIRLVAVALILNATALLLMLRSPRLRLGAGSRSASLTPPR